MSRTPEQHNEVQSRREAIIVIIYKADKPLTVVEIMESLLERDHYRELADPYYALQIMLRRMRKKGHLTARTRHPLRPDVHGNAFVYDVTTPF